MWSETVGLRTKPVSDQKKTELGHRLARCGFSLDLGLAGLVLCCETRSCYALIIKTQQLFNFYF